MIRTIDKDFAKYLKELRQKQGLKLHELSEMCDYSSSHIGRIENGNRRADADYLLTVAPHLGVTQNLLLIRAGYTIDYSLGNGEPPTKPICNTTTLAQSLIQELMTNAVVEVSVNGRHSMARIVKINFAARG